MINNPHNLQQVIENRHFIKFIHHDALKESNKSKFIYFSHYDYEESEGVCSHHGLLTEKWKIIHYFPFDEWEYYDLLTDPDEKFNQIENSVYEQRIKEAKLEFERVSRIKNNNNKRIGTEEWRRNQRKPSMKTR